VEGTPFGRYRLVELLGRGGMGEVWRAYDTATNNRVVAIKLLPPNLAQDETFVERFRREADAAARLNNPHIIPIHTYGEIDGRLYVDMRLVEGRDLQTVLDDGPLKPARAVRIIEQVAKALHAAHKIGLVHRDVKPSNILLDEDDFAYLIDFGIARGVDQTGLTGTGAMIGSWHYMAPERLRAHEADARADIYALACVLYQCLTGERPFPGDTLESQVAAHLTNPPPLPSISRPDVPSKFDPVVAKGMAKDPDKRYPTTVELARDAVDAAAAPAARVTAAAAPDASVDKTLPVTTPTTGPKIADGAAPPTPAADSGFAAAQRLGGYQPPPAYQLGTGQPGGYGAPPTPPPFGTAFPPYPGTPSATSAGFRGWWIVIAAIILGVAALVAGIVILGSHLFSSGRSTVATPTITMPSIVFPNIPFPTTSSASTNPSTPVAPKGPAQLQTPDGLSGLLTTIRDRFGDTKGYMLVVYPDYAVLDRLSPTNAHVKQSFMYRDGAWNNWGPDMSTSSLDFVADLGQFNAAAVSAALKSPPPELNITDATKNYLTVEGAEGGTIDLGIHNAGPGTGFMELNSDGSVKKLYPPS
jgi:Protein kinase domain